MFHMHAQEKWRVGFFFQGRSWWYFTMTVRDNTVVYDNGSQWWFTIIVHNGGWWPFWTDFGVFNRPRIFVWYDAYLLQGECCTSRGVSIWCIFISRQLYSVEFLWNCVEVPCKKERKGPAAGVNFFWWFLFFIFCLCCCFLKVEAGCSLRDIRTKQTLLSLYSSMLVQKRWSAKMPDGYCVPVRRLTLLAGVV